MQQSYKEAHFEEGGNTLISYTIDELANDMARSERFGRALSFFNLAQSVTQNVQPPIFEHQTIHDSQTNYVQTIRLLLEKLCQQLMLSHEELLSAVIMIDMDCFNLYKMRWIFRDHNLTLERVLQILACNIKYQLQQLS